MRDRIPSPGKEGRMLITPENGTPAFFATVAMADEPLQEGDALNKGNLLDDAVAIKHGRNSDAVPNDLFRVLPVSNSGHILVTTRDQSGNIIPSVPVLVDGEYVGDTGSFGEAMFSVPFGVHEITVVKTLDLESITPNVTTLDVHSSDAFRIDAVCVTSDITEVEITETGITGFSGRVADFDICVCGGGAGGSVQAMHTSSDLDMALSGTGGGYVSNWFGLLAAAYRAFLATIGAGGLGGLASTSRQFGKEGGETSVKSLLTKVVHTSKGGEVHSSQSTYQNIGGDGGSGGGSAYCRTASPTRYGVCAAGEDGGDGENYSDSYTSAIGGKGQGTTTRPFEESGRTPLAPGGGAVAALNSTVKLGTTQAEGSPGQSNMNVVDEDVEGVPGTIWGAAGGAFIVLITGKGTAKAADGIQGVVIARWRFAA